MGFVHPYEEKQSRKLKLLVMYPISTQLTPTNVYSTVPKVMFLLISVESTSDLYTEYFRNIFQTHLEITLQMFKVKKTSDIYK